MSFMVILDMVRARPSSEKKAAAKSDSLGFLNRAWARVKTAATARVPKRALGNRQAKLLSPKSLTEPAWISLASGG